jgi:hypothetical protein
MFFIYVIFYVPSILLFINTLYLLISYFLIQGLNFTNSSNAKNLITFIILFILEIFLIYKIFFIQTEGIDSD